MPTLLKVLSWVLLIPAAVLLLSAPFAAAEGNGSAALGLLIMVGLAGGPGWLLRRKAIELSSTDELQAQLVGFVRSHDAFSLQELAAHLGKTPAEAQTLLTRDIGRYKLPLLMHRASGRYLRLDRLSTSARMVDRCPACGGSVGAQIVFETEVLTCPYCASPILTPAHAPHGHAHAAHAQQPYGGWPR